MRDPSSDASSSDGEEEEVGSENRCEERQEEAGIEAIKPYLVKFVYLEDCILGGPN